MPATMAVGEAEREALNDWIDSLERDIEVAEGQIALASVLPEPSKAFIHIEAERLKRLVEAAKAAVSHGLREE